MRVWTTHGVSDSGLTERERESKRLILPCMSLLSVIQFVN